MPQICNKAGSPPDDRAAGSIIMNSRSDVVPTINIQTSVHQERNEDIGQEALETQQIIKQLSEEVSEASTVIKSLVDETNNISHVLGSIQGIATQTNLLA